jgi:hypothetical protein
MKTAKRLLSIVSCCAAAGLLLAPDVADAAPKYARVHVQAPLDLQNPGATNLDSLGYYGLSPIWSHGFEIPYAQVEALINSRLNDIVPNKIGGVEVCTDPCPDVTWSIRIKPKFKFTKTNQPVLTSLGKSGENRVKVELTTEARLDVHADVHAETWADSVDVPVDVFVVVGLKAAVEVELWPTLKVHKPGSTAPGVDLEFSLVNSDIDLDLNGTAVALGAKWGTIIGLSPVGLLVGGPILGPILAWLGDEAADMAEIAISNLFYSKVEGILNAQSAGLEDMVNDNLLPYVDQANNLKDRLMNSPLPGVNKTITQLTSGLGATVELHTTTPDGGVATSAVVRMSGAAGSGKLKGVLRMPKQVCEYARVNGGPLKGAVLPLGLKPTNEDLAAKVGQACSTLSSAPLTAKSYLGASPRAALGATAQDLPIWKNNAGTSKWTGNLTQTDKWYECAFEVSGLPNAAIVSLDSQTWLTQHLVEVTDERFFEAKVGAQVVLDSRMKPVAGGSIVFGGEGKCGGGGGGRGIEASQLQKLKDMLNPEKCPQCGLKRVPGSEHIIEVTNPQAFLDTAAGKELLKTIQANRAAPGVMAKPAGAMKPPAAKPGPALNR